MIGRTNVGGGGNTFAFIVVTYPAGSVCTCSDGTRTIRAKGTTGSFVFNIPYAGTWTVICTNGTLTKSETVAISTTGQRAEVTLRYQLVLYDNGSIETAVSGGLVTNGYTYGGKTPLTIIFNNDNLQFNDPSNNIRLIGTNNKIDVNGYSSAKCTLKPTGTTALHPWFGINTSKTIISPPTAMVLPTQLNVEQTLSIDLRSLSDTELFIFTIVSTPGGAGFVYKIWLE